MNQYQILMLRLYTMPIVFYAAMVVGIRDE